MGEYSAFVVSSEHCRKYLWFAELQRLNFSWLNIQTKGLTWPEDLKKAANKQERRTEIMQKSFVPW
jgi:hypothetical protein